MWIKSTFNIQPVLLFDIRDKLSDEKPLFWVDIIFTLKKVGDMSDETSGIIVKNFTPIVLCQQIHSANITEIENDDSAPGIQNISIVKNCDGLVTSKKNLWLGIRTADCAPVMLFSYIENKIAALHVGRQGALKGIIGKTICNFFKKPAGIYAAVGPHIKKCCYHFDAYNNNEIGQFGRFYSAAEKTIDLTGYIKDQLIKCGLKNDKIYISDYCTYCGGEDKFFSHKRSNGKEKARHLTAIRIRNS